MSQSQKMMLDDNKVSRMIAEKAMLDQTFGGKLHSFASSPRLTKSKRAKDETARVILQTIEEFREQLLDEAGLEVPNHQGGQARNIDIYLKQNITSRPLASKVNGQKEKGTKMTAGECDYEWGWVGSSTCIARLALDFECSNLRFQADPAPFPFLKLPPELRLLVYREALSGAFSHKNPPEVKEVVVTSHMGNTFQFWLTGQARGESKEINACLLAVNKLVNKEATPILYQSRTFDFKTSVVSVVPFLDSLSQEARNILHGISMVLRDKQEPGHCCAEVEKTYGKGRDNQTAWVKVCTHISDTMHLKQLHITINVDVPGGFKHLKWVEALVKIKGLEHLTLTANHHSCCQPLLVRANYTDSLLEAQEHCFSDNLVQLFEYLVEKMVE